MTRSAAQLVEAVLDAPSLEAARRIVEAELPIGVVRQELVVAMRDYAQGEADLPRAWLLSARMAPLATALGLHVHGRWLASDGARARSIELMRVAGIAYEWCGDVMGAGRVTANIANELYRQGGQPHAALAAAAAAEQLFRQSEAPAAEIALCVGKTRMTVQSVYADMQDWEKSFAAVQSVKDLVATVPSPDAALRHMLADAEISSGMQLEDLFDRFDEAAQAYQRAESLLVTVSEQLAPEQTRLSWFRLGLNRAVLALRLGRHGDARYRFDEAGRYVDEKDREDWCDLQLYRAYQALLIGDGGEARRRLDAARPKITQADLPRQYVDLHFYEALLAGPAQSGDRLAQVAEQYSALGLQLLPMVVSLHQAEGAYVAGQAAQAEQILAAVEATLGAYPSPRRRLEVARIRALFAAAPSTEGLRELAEQLRRYSDYAAAASVLSRLGEHYERAQQLEQAEQAYRAAIKALEDARGVLRLSLDTLTFLQQRRRPYERAFALVASQRPAEGFAITERARAQVILDELVNDGLQDLIVHGDLAELRLARDELEQARARAIPQRPRGEHHQAELAGPQAMVDLAVAEQRYLDVLNSLQARGVVDVGWIRGEPASLSEIQQALPPGGHLIAYSLVHSPSEVPELWATVVSAAGVQAQRLAGSADLSVLLDAWRKRPIVTGSGAASREQVDAALKLIYRYLVLPLERHIATAESLIVALDDALPLLPIHAALHPRQGYLVERYVVSYVPSATVLAICARRSRRDSCPTSVIAGWQGDDRLAPLLPQANRELDRLGELLGVIAHKGPFRADEILRLCADAGLIHLVCHGVFPPEAHPRFARLILGAESIYAHDFYRIRLRAELLTMNACDTGLHGPGVQGLVSAALVAGASAVVASMWLVNDAAAPELMERFYTYLLRDGCARAEALCRAQRDLIRGPFSHPADWAPHFLTGLPTALPHLPA